MNRIILLVLLPFVLSGFDKSANKKIIFFGDSITEQGVKKEGFITMLDSLLKKEGRENEFELIGSGISANKVYDLYLRLNDDVLSKNPSAVVIWIGVNDVWHKKILGTGTDADKFEKFYQAIIGKLRKKDITTFLVTPAVVGEKTDFTNELDGDLNKYSQIIRRLAAANDCGLIDMRKIFREYLLEHNRENKDRGNLTYDGVHLNKTGNQLVADSLLLFLTGHFIKNK